MSRGCCIGYFAVLAFGCLSPGTPSKRPENSSTTGTARGVAQTALASSAEPSHPGTLTKAADHLYLCTFNVYKLGSVAEKYTSLEEEGGSEETPEGIPKRIENLAKVLAVGKFDLVVFQEVTDGIQGQAAMTDLVATLRQDHGTSYSFFLSDHIGRGLMAEAIAFMYDPRVVQPEILPGTTSLVQNIEIPGRDLVRTQWEADDFDFTLIAGHLAWSNEEHRDQGYQKIDEIFSTPTPSQFSGDPDIIVLGDFNRFGTGYDSVKELTYDPSEFLAPNITFFDSEFSQKKSVTKTSIQHKGVPDDNPQFVSTTVAGNAYVYDMILISADVKEEFPPGAGEAIYALDFGIVHFDETGGFGHIAGAEQLSHNPLKNAYSDHRPLWMRFKTNTGKNDDPPGGVNLTPVVENQRYVATASGRRFHRPTCRTIKGRETPRAWTSREAAARVLGPCGVCKP